MPRWLATVLLVAWLVPIAAPHAGTDDDLCFPSGVGTGAATVKTQITAEKPAHHCDICHSLRSFRTALADCGPAAATLAVERFVSLEDSHCQRAATLAQLPARAPPANL